MRSCNHISHISQVEELGKKREDLAAENAQLSALLEEAQVRVNNLRSTSSMLKAQMQSYS